MRAPDGMSTIQAAHLTWWARREACAFAHLRSLFYFRPASFQRIWCAGANATSDLLRSFGWVERLRPSKRNGRRQKRNSSRQLQHAVSFARAQPYLQAMVAKRYSRLPNNSTLKVPDDVIIDGRIEPHEVKEHEHRFNYLFYIIHPRFAHRPQDRSDLRR
jgi:hypothetical protein